jgi:uncharacterized membrane protein
MSKTAKRIVAILSSTLMIAIAIFSLGIAYAGGIRGIGLLGIWFFMTFGIAVVLAQVIPAVILFVSFIGAVFSPSRRSEVPVSAT